MKNKHLVVLFFATLAVGLLIRQAPWRRLQIFQADLIGVDTAVVTQISIFRPDRPELLLERTEAGWAATQELRSVKVPAEQISEMLTTLAYAGSVRIVKTDAPDTLGLPAVGSLQIRIYCEKEELENFEIGREIMENGRPATYIRLKGHEGIYLVEGRLNSIFQKDVDSFRSKIFAGFDVLSVKEVELWWPKESVAEKVFLQKNDSTGRWTVQGNATPEITGDSMQHWLQSFSLFDNSPFADHFDENHAREALLSRIILRMTSSDSLALSVFYLKPPDLPEEITVLKAGRLPLYVVQSSQNALNYFAPRDTALIRKAFFTWKPVSPPPLKSAGAQKK